MKKLIFLSSIFFSSLAHAQQTVQIFWPFSAGSSQANMIRSIIDNANGQQNKYKFIFVHKPGAGGSVAANAVSESKDLAILASTSSFYIRPLLYENSHSVTDFSVASVFCKDQPLGIFSKTINTLSSDREISIGVIPGSITTLLTRTIKRENPSIIMTEVPYKGTVEATTDMLGRHIDGSVDFVGLSVVSRFDSAVNVVGITGTRSIKNYRTFNSMSIKGVDSITNDYMFLIKGSVDSSNTQELNSIITSSIGNSTKSLCESDFGQLSNIPYTQLNSYHHSNQNKWKSLTRDIVKQ